MKIFLDRLGFVFHRPRFFGKIFTSIVTQGIFRGNKIVQYLDGPVKKLAGSVFDSIQTRITRKRKS